MRAKTLTQFPFRPTSHPELGHIAFSISPAAGVGLKRFANNHLLSCRLKRCLVGDVQFLPVRRGEEACSGRLGAKSASGLYPIPNVKK